MNGLLFFEARLPDVEKRRTNHHVGCFEIPLNERERAIAVQRGPYERGRLGMAIKQDIFPRNENVIENDESIDLVEAIRKRIVFDRCPPGKTSSTDHFDAG